MAGNGQQVTGVTSAGSTRHPPRCLPTRSAGRRRARGPGPRSSCARPARREVGAVEGGPGVVAHAAVDADVGAVEVFAGGDRLDRAHLVEGDAGLADDDATGLGGDVGHRDAAHRALVGDGVDDAVGDLFDGLGVVDRGVRDAEAAADVEQGDLSPGEQVGVQVDQARRRLAEAGGVEDLRADVACRPTKRRLDSSRMRATASAAPSSENRTSGLRGRWRGTRGSRRARPCARARAPTARRRGARRCGETLDLDGLSTTTEPMPTSTARSSSDTFLLLPWNPGVPGRRPRRARPRAHRACRRRRRVPRRRPSARPRSRGTPCRRSTRGLGCRGARPRRRRRRARTAGVGRAPRSRRARTGGCRSGRAGRRPTRRRPRRSRRRRDARTRARRRRRARSLRPGR